MEQLILEILDDLYALDNSLKAYEKELKDAIKKLLENKPDTQFDEAFQTRLRSELLSKIEQLKEEPVLQERESWFGRVLKKISHKSVPASALYEQNPEVSEKDMKSEEKGSPLVSSIVSSIHFSLPAMVTAVVVLFIVSTLAILSVNYYQSGGGNIANIFQTKGDTLFAMEPTIQDVTGVDPNTSFIIKTSENLSERKIKELVTFEPKVDFSVKKIGKTSWLAPTALANEDSSQLGYRYEIKVTEPLKENQVYKVTIKDTKVADREYQWAFQVKAPFGVIETTPADKATYVPVDTFIEIKFNRQLPKDAGDSFSISPKAEGSVEVKNDTLYFYPKDLKAETVYTVRIQAGLTAQDTKEPIENDMVFSFETREKNDDDRPFTLRTPYIETLPDKNPGIEIYPEDEEETINIEVYQMDNLEEYISSIRKSQDWTLSWTVFSKNRQLEQYKPDESKKIFSAENKMVKTQFSSVLEIPQPLAEGYYFVVLSHKEHREGIWIQSSSIAHYFALASGKSILWLNDLSKRTPLSNANVSFIDSNNDSKQLGQSSDDGLTLFDTPEVLFENIDKPMFLKVAADGYKPIGLNVAKYASSVSKGDNYWDFIALDKNKYLPVDRIQYWGVLKGRYMKIKDATLTVGLYKDYPAYNKVDNKVLPLVSEKKMVSQSDTIEGSLDIKGLEPRNYWLVVSDGNGEVVSVKDILVETYTKPAYQISITPSKQAIYTGETIEYDVKAAFYDGTPLANAKLSYEIAYGGGNDTKEVQLDRDGHAKLQYTPDYKTERAYEYPMAVILTVQPALAEEGDILGTCLVEVFGANIMLQAEQKLSGNGSQIYIAKVNKLDIKNPVLDEFGYSVREHVGEPVANQPVKAEVVKVTFEKKENGDEYYDYISKTVKKRYQYERKEAVIEELEGMTDEKGEWNITKNFPVEKGVSYFIRFLSQDASGKKVRDVAYVVMDGYSESEGLKINVEGGHADRYHDMKFHVGETVKITASIVGESTEVIGDKILYYRYQNGIDKAFVSSGKDWQEQFEDGFAPNVTYKAAILTPSGFQESNTDSAYLDLDDKQLDVEIQTQKEIYRPKDDVEVAIRVKDKDGKPVTGEVNVSVVDEALFQDSDDWSGNILTNLYESVHYYPVVDYTDYSNVLKGDGMGGCFAAGTPIIMADGATEPIENIRAGDQVLTYTDLGSRSLGSAIVQNVSSHVVDEYLLVNDSLQVTAEHRLFINGTWTYAGNMQVGDSLVGPDGANTKIVTIKKILAPNTRVYNIMVGKYHTYFAQGFYVHNEGKDGARMNFLDVVKFESVKTDDNGQASVSFKAPDNLTSWRVTTRAYAPAQMMAGQNIKLVPVGLPLFVDVTMNGTYLTGDKPEIRARVFGTNYNPGAPITYIVESESLHIHQESSIKEPTAYISLGALPYGKHDITLQVKQGDLTDTVTRKINVNNSYAKYSVSKVYPLSKELENIEGNESGYTELVFADKGRGKYYESLERNAVIDSVRSDQLAAGFYSRKLLADTNDADLPDGPINLDQYIQGVPLNERERMPIQGLSLLPYSSPDLELSAKLADITGGTQYAATLKQYFETSMSDEKADIHRVTKALYGLASLGEPVLVQTQIIKDREGLTLEDKIYLALALAKQGDKEGARTYYDTELKPALTVDNNQAWIAKVDAKDDQNSDLVKLTATLGMLAAEINADEEAQIWNYMSTHDPERNLDVLEATLMAKAAFEREHVVPAGFTMKTDEREEVVSFEKLGLFRVMLSRDELENLRFSDIDGEIDVVSYFEKPQAEENRPNEKTFNLVRKYQVEGNTTNLINDGAVVKVTLEPIFKEGAQDGTYQITDALPSGLKPATTMYSGVRPYADMVQWDSAEDSLQKEELCHRIWYPNMIDGNLVSFSFDRNYARNNNCSTFSISYYARVTSRGSFRADGATMQSLSDLHKLTTTSADQIEIKE